MDVLIETIPKDPERKPRKAKFELSHAEKILRKSKNWKLPDNSEFVFKDGALSRGKAKKES